MIEIKLTKRYPNSRTEDITDAYMRGWNDALDAVQNGKFHIADTPQTEQTEHLVKLSQKPRDSHEIAKDEPQTVNWSRNVCTLELFDDDGNYIEPQTDCSWK